MAERLVRASWHASEEPPEGLPIGAVVMRNHRTGECSWDGTTVMPPPNPVAAARAEAASMATDLAVGVLTDAARVERGRAVAYTEQLAKSQAPNYGDMARAAECRLRAEMLDHLADTIRTRFAQANLERVL